MQLIKLNDAKNNNIEIGKQKQMHTEKKACLDQSTHLNDTVSVSGATT